MATLEQLSTALVNADAAGDVQAARALAAEITRMRGHQSVPQANAVTDTLKAGGVGLAEGAIGVAGLPGDVKSLMGSGLEAFERHILGSSEQDIARRNQAAQSAPSIMPGSQSIKSGIEGVTGEFYQPQTTAGEYARTVGQFAPAALMGPGSLARKAVTQAAIPAVTSETAGQLTKGTEAEPYARVAGALGGAVLPSVFRRAATPLPTSAERAKSVNVLRKEGVTDLTAGQATGREPLRYFEAERGRGGALMERQAEQFTAAALKRAGIKAGRATPEVIDDAFSRIGQNFDDLAAGNTATVDRRMVSDIGGAIDDYNSMVAAPNRAPVIENFVTELSNTIQKNAGKIPGEVYQSLRSRMEKAARGLGRNPEAQMAVRDMKNALDDAMERSIATTNPRDLGAWRTARREYRNMLVIEKAATSAGENAAEGLISPRALRQATLSQGKRAYARGKGDFADLSRAGVNVMSPLPNSGTAGRVSAQNLGFNLLSMAGGAAGGAAATGPDGSPYGAAMGALMGAIAPRAIGRVATSSLGRRYLSNQAFLPPASSRLGQQALIGGLLASQGQRLLPAQ